MATPLASPINPRLSTAAPEHGSMLSTAWSSPAESRKMATCRPSTSAATPRSGVSRRSSQMATQSARSSAGELLLDGGHRAPAGTRCPRISTLVIVGSGSGELTNETKRLNRSGSSRVADHSHS